MGLDPMGGTPTPVAPARPPGECIAALADIVGAHEQTVRGWIHSGELKASKFGTRIGWRVRRADYDDFLRRRQLTGAVARQLLALGTRDLDPAS